MASRARPDRLLTVEEYLEWENRSPRRHEYVAGRVYAMVGGTIRHNLVAGNIYNRLSAAGQGGPCRAFINHVKVQVAGDRIYYPDVAVVRGPLDQREHVARQPCLVVEVTSRSTRRVDFGEKLDAYRGNQAIRAYLIVDQGVRRVERHWRDERAEWQHVTVDDTTDGHVPVPCPSTELTLDEIYDGIELDPPDEALPTRPRRVREPEPT